MSVQITNSTTASSIVRELHGSSSAQRASQEKLASGTRVRNASDDAASLSIAMKDRAMVRSMNQATRNAHDVVSAVQIAEGGMNEVSSMMIRLRELATQASSDTIGDHERNMVHAEFSQLKSEIRRISETTEINGVNLLNQFAKYLEVQAGPGGSADVDRLYLDLRHISTEPERLGISLAGVSTKENARDALGHIDRAMETLSLRRAEAGAFQNQVLSAINNNQTYAENLTGAESRLRDIDMAEESSTLAQHTIKNQMQTSLLAQSGASDRNMVLKLLG